MLDEEQEGFRKYRGTTLALLRLTQDIFKGFNKNKHTLAILIDMEKAYDTIWCEGLMVKLARMGINGNMWKWLYSLIKGRKAKCTLKKFDGEMFETIMGLQQRSVLSPVLFNLFCRYVEECSSKLSEICGRWDDLENRGRYKRNCSRIGT